MSLAKLSPEARKRVASAWTDPEVSQSALRERFNLCPQDLQTLKSELGPKARIGSVSCFGPNQIRAARRRKQLRAMARAAM